MLYYRFINFTFLGYRLLITTISKWTFLYPILKFHVNLLYIQQVRINKYLFVHKVVSMIPSGNYGRLYLNFQCENILIITQSTN